MIIRYQQVDNFIIENSIIVNIGCGQEGLFLKRHRYKIKNSYGFDFKINDLLMDNLVFINNSPIGEFLLDKESVDTIFMNALLKHLDNPENVLLKALDILKINGKIIMTTLTAFSIFRQNVYKIFLFNCLMSKIILNTIIIFNI